MSPELIAAYVLSAVTGLIAGSFLNVVIFRYKTGESIIRPPSRCPHCRTRLKLWDLVPVFSFLFLRGRCRYCKARLSCRYIIMEIMTAVIFLLSLHYFGLSPLFIKYAILFSVLLVISGIDLEAQLIPNRFVLFLMFWGILWQLVYPNQELSSAALGLVAGGGAFLLIALVARGGMGGGDIKLMAVLGFIAGWPAVLGVFLLAFCSGALTGVSLVILKKKTRKSAIPFGPFIALGFFITTLWGAALWEWYLSLFQSGI